MLLRKYHIAVVGATGLVGQEFIKVLEKRDFPMASVHLFASNKSAGKKLFINHSQVELKELTRNSFDPVEIAFFAAGSEVSQHFIPRAVKRAAVAIDCSGVFGMDEGVPLVVPEVNPQDLENHHGLIASPNGTTIQLVVALYPLHRVNPIKRIVVDTYQAVSETGSTAVDELNTQIKLVLKARAVCRIFSLIKSLSMCSPRSMCSETMAIRRKSGNCPRRPEKYSMMILSPFQRLAFVFPFPKVWYNRFQGGVRWQGSWGV